MKLLNDKETQEKIQQGGVLHEDYTSLFSVDYHSWQECNEVYELPDGSFLFVFCNTYPTKSEVKSELYEREKFLEYVDWRKHYNTNITLGIQDSDSHWRYYSNLKQNIVFHIEKLINELPDLISLPKEALDLSYKSLDLISKKLKTMTYEEKTMLYDHLVAYTGEIIRLKTNGNWNSHIDKNEVYDMVVPFWGKNFYFRSDGWLLTISRMLNRYTFRSKKNYVYTPEIITEKNTFSPVNVVWREITGLEKQVLRKETIAEIRRNTMFQKNTKE